VETVARNKEKSFFDQITDGVNEMFETVLDGVDEVFGYPDLDKQAEKMDRFIERKDRNV